MSAMTTLAPWRRKSLAVASPMPLAPPVMSATLPSNLHVHAWKGKYFRTE